LIPSISRFFYIKDAFRSSQSIVENVDEIFQKIKENRHVSSYDN